MKLKVWYDAEGDFLEVMFDQKPGHFRESGSDQVMVKVDEAGNLLGFSILKISALKQAPLDLAFGGGAGGYGDQQRSQHLALRTDDAAFCYA